MNEVENKALEHWDDFIDYMKSIGNDPNDFTYSQLVDRYKEWNTDTVAATTETGENTDAVDAMTDEEFFAAQEAERQAMKAVWDRLINGLSYEEAKDMIRGLMGLILGPSPLSPLALHQNIEIIRKGEGIKLDIRPYVTTAIDFIEKLNKEIDDAAGPIARKRENEFIDHIKTFVKGLLDATHAQETDTCSEDDHSTPTPEDCPN